MAEVTVRLWLLAWPDGRVHAHAGDTAPKRWSDLVASDGCLVHEGSATVEQPVRKVVAPVDVKPVV